jgi:hypothetical protein
MTTSTINIELEEFEAAVSSSNFRYAKARSWRASGQVLDDSDYRVWAYGISDNDSYVHALTFCRDFKTAVAILDKHNKPFPLSPTEKY